MIRYSIKFDEKVANITPVTCGSEECLKGHYYGPTERDYYLIHFIVSGKGIYTVGDKTYNLKANDLFIIKPDETTYYKASDIDPWQYVWVGFYCSDEEIKNIKEYVYSAPELFSVFDEIKRSLPGDRLNYLVISKIAAILYDLLNKHSLPKSYEDIAKQIIDTEFSNGIKIQDISEKIGVDRGYLSKLFKKKYSLSPEQYLIKLKMEKALEYLLVYHQSITMTCYSLGYDDIYLFSKLFKKYYGKSPRNYLKEIKGL